MCMDFEGGIWICWWVLGKVLCFMFDGEIDVEIDFFIVWYIICCIFGGKLSIRYWV